MSIARIIRAAALPEVAWKNGGGTTREIAVYPPGASMEDFVWRISMARVETAGAFSRFAGIDRVLAVLEGRLRLCGPAGAVELDGDSAPFPFDGEAPVTGAPLAGAVLDFNAMARRGQCAVHMERLAAGEAAVCEGASFVLALEPQRLGDAQLDRLDCALLSGTMILGGPALAVRFRA